MSSKFNTEFLNREAKKKTNSCEDKHTGISRCFFIHFVSTLKGEIVFTDPKCEMQNEVDFTTPE